MSYEELKEKIESEGHSLPVTAENENGELVIIEEGVDDDVHYYKTTTAQNNDWCRINCFYADGTVTETFER